MNGPKSTAAATLCKRWDSVLWVQLSKRNGVPPHFERRLIHTPGGSSLLGDGLTNSFNEIV